MFESIGRIIADFEIYKDNETTGKVAFALICLVIILAVL